MKTSKKDMHETCDLNYGAMWYKCCVMHTISQEEFDKWLSEHCAKCKYMSDICMYEEESNK